MMILIVFIPMMILVDKHFLVGLCGVANAFYLGDMLLQGFVFLIFWEIIDLVKN